jgi:hypothetical protein
MNDDDAAVESADNVHMPTLALALNQASSLTSTGPSSPWRPQPCCCQSQPFALAVESFARIHKQRQVIPPPSPLTASSKSLHGASPPFFMMFDNLFDHLLIIFIGFFFRPFLVFCWVSLRVP